MLDSRETSSAKKLLMVKVSTGCLPCVLSVVYAVQFTYAGLDPDEIFHIPTISTILGADVLQFLGKD